jgi:hypothetical protein
MMFVMLLIEVSQMDLSLVVRCWTYYKVAYSKKMPSVP